MNDYAKAKSGDVDTLTDSFWSRYDVPHNVREEFTGEILNAYQSNYTEVFDDYAVSNNSVKMKIKEDRGFFLLGTCPENIVQAYYDRNFHPDYTGTFRELRGVRLKFIARSFAVDPKLFGKFKHPKHAEILAYPYAWDSDC